MKTIIPLLIGSSLSLLVILVASYAPVLLYAGLGLSFGAAILLGAMAHVRGNFGWQCGGMETRPESDGANVVCDQRDSLVTGAEANKYGVGAVAGGPLPLPPLTTSQLKQADVMREAISELLNQMKGK